VKPARLSVAN